MIHRLVQFKSDSRFETIWLTIYADLITNMMLVFLALYGLTVMGDDAMSRAIQSMKLDDMHIPKNNKLNIEFDDLAPALRQKFEVGQDIKVSEEVGAVRIEFGENVLFRSGSAAPKASAVEEVRVVAELLKKMPHTIVVEGHTDSMPLHAGGAYRDNNELSLARAMSIADLLIKDGLPASQIAAAAYGAYQPRASNLTSLGRATNRRVEIAIFKDFPYVDQRK